MNEPKVRKSHTTVWIVAVAAVAVLYVFGYPWLFWGWAYFGGKVPDWLFTSNNSWFWMGEHFGLNHCYVDYWSWTRDVCRAWAHGGPILDPLTIRRLR